MKPSEFITRGWCRRFVPSMKNLRTLAFSTRMQSLGVQLEPSGPLTPTKCFAGNLSLTGFVLGSLERLSSIGMMICGLPKNPLFRHLDQ